MKVLIFSSVMKWIFIVDILIFWKEKFQRYFVRPDMREISTEEFRKLSADKKARTFPINTHRRPLIQGAKTWQIKKARTSPINTLAYTQKRPLISYRGEHLKIENARDCWKNNLYFRSMQKVNYKRQFYKMRQTKGVTFLCSICWQNKDLFNFSTFSIFWQNKMGQRQKRWGSKDLFNFSGKWAFCIVAGEQQTAAGNRRKPQWKVI